MNTKIVKSLQAIATAIALYSASATANAFIVFDPSQFTLQNAINTAIHVPQLATNIATTANTIKIYLDALENLKSLPQQLRQEVESALGQVLDANLNDLGLSWQNGHLALDPNSENYSTELNDFLSAAVAITTMPREFEAVKAELSGIPAMLEGNFLRNAQIDSNRYQELQDTLRRLAAQRKNGINRQALVANIAEKYSKLTDKSGLQAQQLQGTMSLMEYQQREDQLTTQSAQILAEQRREAAAMAEREAVRKRTIDEAKKAANQSRHFPSQTGWTGF